MTIDTVLIPLCIGILVGYFGFGGKVTWFSKRPLLNLIVPVAFFVLAWRLLWW